MTETGRATDQRVSLTIPAQPPLVRLVRLAAGGLGSLVDFDVERIEDLKIAVGEACSTLIEAGGGEPLTVEMEASIERGVVVVVRTANGDREAVDEDRWALSARILGVITEDLEIDLSGAEARIAFVVGAAERTRGA